MDTPYWFIHSSTDGHLGCLYILAVVNNASMNIHEQIFVSTPVFNLGKCTPRIGIAWSCGTYAKLFE